MDCYIYAVEKSLDSYKFNLLHNKQVFINQLKSRNLAARTIDEGAIDENGGGNFSEYVAILSGNNDLLEKAKLDKKLAVLESERQAYHRNKGNAKGKLNEKTSEIEKNNVFIGRFTKDWEYLNKVAPADAETGLRPNPLKLDGVDSDNIEILGNRLAAINQKARTEDDYMKIGTLFDFRILVRTQKSYDGDTQVLHNKFMVEGLDGIKYTYNNGYIAKEPKLAVMNFINALERIPAMIEKREKENAELSKDIPVLREIVAATWPKDSEIKQLGEELASLNRKIQLTLKPVGLHEEGKDEKVMSEKEHACRERDDARTIANEKTASNDLLLKKMTGMEADLEKYKDLQEQYKELQDKFSALQSQLNESKLRAEIDKERAVMDKEREMQERIREADRENAKLQAKIEQLSPAEASPK